MIVVQTLYKMKKKRGMFMENEQSVVLTNWKRNYLFFLSGQFLSGITSMVVQYAIIWYLTRETGSATILSFATLTRNDSHGVTKPICRTASGSLG